MTNKKGFTCEIRDINGFTFNKAETLRKSIEETKNSKEVFNNEEELMNSLLKED